MRHRVGAAALIVVLLASLSTARAQPSEDCLLFGCVLYVPAIQVAPPPLSALVLQPDDVPSFALRASYELTNTTAAEKYLDPAAALAAFAAQHRESSWYVRYYQVHDDILVFGQTIRYWAADGADAGMEYALADERAQRSYDDLRNAGLGDRSVFCTRTFVLDGIAYTERLYAVRKGRHVAFVFVSWQTGDSVDGLDIARRAAARLP